MKKLIFWPLWVCKVIVLLLVSCIMLPAMGLIDIYKWSSGNHNPLDFKEVRMLFKELWGDLL